MRVHLLACAAAIAAAAFSTAAAADTPIPVGGMTADDVTAWLQKEGYQAKVVTEQNGSKTISSSSGGVGFHVGFYDCQGTRCGSFQFFAGFNTNGALNPVKMNEWNRSERWARGYVDNTNDPWVEMDIDLTPGGTYEMLDDEFATWRAILARFKQFIGP